MQNLVCVGMVISIADLTKEVMKNSKPSFEELAAVRGFWKVNWTSKEQWRDLVKRQGMVVHSLEDFLDYRQIKRSSPLNYMERESTEIDWKDWNFFSKNWKSDEH